MWSAVGQRIHDAFSIFVWFQETEKESKISFLHEL